MIKHTDSVVAVQDLRTSLASITDRAVKGESFLVMRNSRPVFRIVPAEDAFAYPPAAPRKPASLGELRARYQASGLARALKPGELEDIIREVHQDARPRG
jgi:prevent-host-death family protein